MVNLYLLTGQDSLSKEIKLKRIREEFLSRDLEDFNLDVLYARDLNLKGLQEKLLCLPFKAQKRIIVIKEAQALKADVQEYLLAQAKKIPASILLVLDISQQNPGENFLRQIARYAKVFSFSSAIPPDTFTLSRQIELKKADYALRLLHQLLCNGEKPERILGGLRYSWQKHLTNSPLEKKRKLKLLLNCDIDIKTGRLKPEFALEKLILELCCFKHFSH